MKMLRYDDEAYTVKTEQISIILGPNFVISFQEMQGDVFNPLRERIRAGKGRIRRMGVDYLAYSIIDSVVDHYFILLEKCGEQIERLEEELALNPQPETLQAIHNLKQEIIFLRKSVWPLREVISGLERVESSLIHDNISMYLRDLYDHTIQVIDSVETYQDILSGMIDLYLSSVSNKMNEVMKVLTIFASIFIPLTFMAGVYGMNFEFMPELKMRWAYPTLWGAMIAVAVTLLTFFKRKKWL
jgi:magnesium transporter